MASARVQKEIKRLAKSPPPGISAWPSDENSTAQLQVQMQGPTDTPYEQGLFKLEVCVPPRYPFEPPKVQFKTPVYHPNIDAQGRICLDVLNMPPKGSWGPALDLSKVLMAVRQLLAEPNPKDPLVVDIAEECASQPERFKMRARQHVARHARPHHDTAASHQQDAAAEGSSRQEPAAAAAVAAATAVVQHKNTAAAALGQQEPAEAAVTSISAAATQHAGQLGLAADRDSALQQRLPNWATLYTGC